MNTGKEPFSCGIRNAECGAADPPPFHFGVTSQSVPFAAAPIRFGVAAFGGKPPFEIPAEVCSALPRRRYVGMGSTAAPAVVFDALGEHIPPVFPARALETAREARALPPIVHPKMNSGNEFPSVPPCGCAPSARFPCGIRIADCGMRSALSRLPCPASRRTKQSHLRLKCEPGSAISCEKSQPNEIAKCAISNRAGTEGHALSAQSGASCRRQ